MPFKLFARKLAGSERLERGQEWYGETVAQNLASIEYEGCRNLFERYIPRDGITLEAGCGLARWVLFFRRKGYPIMGCDIDHQALKEARWYDPDARLVTADICALPLKPECCDTIISLGVIEHFENGPEKLLEEMRGALRTNGILLVAVPYNSLFRQLLVNRVMFLKSLIWRVLKCEAVFTEYRYSRSELRAYLEAAGFEVLAFYPEMLTPPRHVGAYLDFIHLTGCVPGRKFEAPMVMRLFSTIVRFASPWFNSGMVMGVSLKKGR
jgi:SAM-dependent methyltransferase